MDLNELLFQHQIALMRAAKPHNRQSGGHFDLVRHYETRIDRLRNTLGVAPYPHWGANSPPAAS